jgi:hypothetical protein
MLKHAFAKFLLLLATGSLSFGWTASGQNSAKTADSNNKQSSTAETKVEKPKLTQEELEANFKSSLTKATFNGRWCMIAKDGQLGPEKEDKYSIQSVAKIGGEMWLINARIQYGKHDFVAPIPVQVKWAGDTPVITLDKVGVAGSGEYSARVLVYNKTYAGTWSSGDHRGLLNGVITVEKE